MEPVGTYLVVFYNGNETKAALLAATETSVGADVEDIIGPCGHMVEAIVELHHDYTEGDPEAWNPKVWVDDVFHNIRELPTLRDAVDERGH